MLMVQIIFYKLTIPFLSLRSKAGFFISYICEHIMEWENIEFSYCIASTIILEVFYIILEFVMPN